MTFPISHHTPVAVICAMDNELIHLRTMLPQAYEDWYMERCSWVTSLDNHSLVLCRCGVGLSNAAAATEAVIARHRPAVILNYGCSGSHRPDLLPGDLVVGSRLVMPDRVVVETDGSEHYAGMWYLHHGVHEQVKYLSCSSDLLEMAAQTATTLEGTHELWPLEARWPSSIPHRSPRVRIGTIATSDRWNRAADRISQIVAQHDSLCEDMEAAAIALICASHDIPFLMVKDISNNELLQTGGGQILPLLPSAAEGQLGRRAAAFIYAMLHNHLLS